MKSTTGNMAPVSANEFRERSKALAAEFHCNAVATERERRVSDQAMASIHNADLFRMLQPKRFGGLESDFDVFQDCVFELARGCGSTAWVFANCGIHQWLMATFPLRAQEEVWGTDQKAVAAGSYSPVIAATVDGDGFRLNGTWPFVSGSVNAQWSLLGATIKGDSPIPALFLVPQSDYQIDDMWFAAGLCGTSSNDITLDNVFVPSHRVVPFDDLNNGVTAGSKAYDNRLYSIPFLSFVPYGIATAAHGMLQGAIDATLDLMAVRTTRGATSGSGRRVANFPHVQSRIAEATACLDAARLLFQRDRMETHDTVVRAGEALSVEQRIRNRRDHGMSTRLVVQGINALYDNVGGAGLTLDNVVQRCWRDINACAKHGGLNWDAHSTMYGQHLLGLKPKGGF